MKIFLDIGHPAHVHYFKNIIKLLKDRGHTFIISARDKEVSQQLLNLYGIDYLSRGKGSNRLFGKMIYLVYADYLLFKLAYRFKPDMFLSFASPYVAHVSRIMGKPHIALTDTENAPLGILSFKPFTNCILTPQAFSKDLGRKHVRFNGFMEQCYLAERYFKPVQNLLPEFVKDSVILRFVSWGANHDINQRGFSDYQKVALVKFIEKYNYKLFISSEYGLPDELLKYKIDISPDKLHSILYYSKLYIGEGATMASESAILGTPAIYYNSIEAGTIREQSRAGLVFHYTDFEKLLNKTKEVLSNPNTRELFRERRDMLLENKIDVTAFIAWFIDTYPVSYNAMTDNPAYEYRFLYK